MYVCIRSSVYRSVFAAIFVAYLFKRQVTLNFFKLISAFINLLVGHPDFGILYS